MNPIIEAAMAKYPKARRIAVENATFGLHKGNFGIGERMNISADAASYKWNSATVNAIHYVIKNNPVMS
jgi:hypothetical protein